MISTHTKRNVTIGVLTGILVGFVLGVVFYSSDRKLDTEKGNASGNIAKIATMGKFCEQSDETEKMSGADTIRYEAVGTDGKNTEILIIK